MTTPNTTKTQFINELHEALIEEDGFEEITKAEAKVIYQAFVGAAFNTLLTPGGKVPLEGLCNLTNKETPAKPARTGRNPSTGEEIEIAPKPASVKLRMSALKAYREASVERYEALNKPKKSRRGSKTKTSGKTAGKTSRRTSSKGASKTSSKGATRTAPSRGKKTRRR